MMKEEEEKVVSSFLPTNISNKTNKLAFAEKKKGGMLNNLLVWITLVCDIMQLDFPARTHLFGPGNESTAFHFLFRLRELLFALPHVANTLSFWKFPPKISCALEIKIPRCSLCRLPTWLLLLLLSSTSIPLHHHYPRCHTKDFISSFIKHQCNFIPKSKYLSKSDKNHFCFLLKSSCFSLISTIAQHPH